jgi:small-conductance mechanosensitive channel
VLVDLREKRELELASQVAWVRAHARPWRSIITLVLALAAAAVAGWFGQHFPSWGSPGQLTDKAITAGAAAGFCVFGTAAAVGLSGKARDRLRPVTGSSHAAVIRYSGVLLGSMAVLVITLDLFKVPIGQLLLGGALTTILIGIAAQQSLSNVFAGMVLLLSRPFTVGDPIRLRSGSLGGLIEGTVTEIGITYLRMDTSEGELRLPNSQVLAAGVGAAQPGSGPGGGGKPAPP